MDKFFTTKLSELRKEKGLTLQGLSRSVGISHPALWNFEQGKKSLSQATLVKSAKVLGVPVSEIAKKPVRAESVSEFLQRSIDAAPVLTDKPLDEDALREGLRDAFASDNMAAVHLLSLEILRAQRRNLGR